MGDTLMVSAEVAGSPVRAILDSGSAASIINTRLVESLDIAPSGKRIIRGTGGRVEVTEISDVALTVADDRRRLPFAIVSDLAAISSEFGRPIDLVLGEDILAGRCVALDFTQDRIGFAPTGSFAGGSGWRRLPLTHGTRSELLVTASIGGGSPVQLIFDLGSANALMLSTPFVAAQDLLAGKARSTAALGSLDGVQIVTAFVLDDIVIGEVLIAGVPVAGLDHWQSDSAVGSIGLPLIAQFDVIMDITAESLWLRPAPPKHRLPMLKDRSGFGLAVSPSALTVAHVAVHSPAEKSGWSVGDRIVRIDGRPINASYTRGQLWRWRFLPAGTHFRLVDGSGIVRLLTLADYY
ncbi:retropepsin-like aspartic protease [Sphingobium sp. AntQ-1]|uniref:retropepsin-like aspartic protease n=1 Tax=Sphingobium sp. AntQ-1 TaxID=2930091 RepID=UPI00234E6BE5|nr:aspartyl protease family protein [Sphingobium sp. AntQ-1]